MALWTKEQDSLLRSYCADGMTFREIAANLSAAIGKTISRNACIGRALRLKIEKKATQRSSPVRVKRAPRRFKTVTSPRTLVHSVVIRKSPSIAKPEELSKSQLRAMITDAVQNTARLSQ
jgi:hypothetical protein